MTTTSNPTAESVIYRVLLETLGEAHDRVSHKIDQSLRAHNLLSEGAPSEEQIERAAQAAFNRPGAYRGCIWAPGHLDSTTEATRQEFRDNARAALTAAGVAPQEPCPQPCEHLSADDAREGRDCREHPCTCPTAPSSGREKLIEEARAVAGPKSLYAHTSVAHLLIRLADALVAAQGAAPQAETPQCGPCRRGQHGCCDGNEYLRCDCGHVTPVPSSGVDEDKLAEVIARSSHRATDSGTNPRIDVRRALTAAGVATQEPPALDPVKVAEVLNRHEPIFKDGLYAGRCICGFEHPSYSGWRLHRSGALCEAAKRGELS